MIGNVSYLIDYEEINGGVLPLEATSDESRLWHRRLGHLNFKTMNKLVNGNLVRGTKDNNNAGQARKKKVPDKDYILPPLWTADPPFPQEPKNKKMNAKIKEEKDSVNNTNRVNAVSSTGNAASNEVNDVGRKSGIELSDDPDMPELEDISIF
nr:ribonuclease H-like domain-containing protein [Tanacetum cinerariifolium]